MCRLPPLLCLRRQPLQLLRSLPRRLGIAQHSKPLHKPVLPPLQLLVYRRPALN